METKNAWLIVRYLVIIFVFAILLPIFFARGIALLHLSDGNALLFKRIFGLAVLIAGTLVQNAALGIGFMVGGYWTMVSLLFLFDLYGVSAKVFVILLMALAALIRALIIWDKEYLETTF